MTGVQVHTSSPISTNASKSKEATIEATKTQDGPLRIPASTTTGPVNPMQAAQPGATAVPMPARTPSTAASKYIPPSPTRTTTVLDTPNPPPPQPGQVPQPQPDRANIIGSSSAHIPRMPQNIQVQAQTQRDAPVATYAPPELLKSTYAYAQPPAGQTMTPDLTHPPGYVQNSHASFDDRNFETGNATHTTIPTKTGGGILDGAPSLQHADEGTSPIWDTAVSWAKEAGKKLSEVEGEVWKKINGDT